jgi:hypothetical protein
MRLSFRDMVARLRRELFKAGTRPRPASLPEPPSLWLLMRPILRKSSWHPAKAMDGSPQTQVVVDLECSNGTSSPIRLVAARLRDHAAKETILLVGTPEGQPVADDLAVPPDGKVRVRATFFLEGRPHRPGEWFNDVLVLVDQEWREHRLKIGVCGA